MLCQVKISNTICVLKPDKILTDMELHCQFNCYFIELCLITCLYCEENMVEDGGSMLLRNGITTQKINIGICPS